MAATHLKFTLPTLKKLNKWYFEYYELDKNGKQTVQHRPTFGINRIKNLQEREREAEKKLNALKNQLGFKTKPIDNLDKQTITEALDRVVHLKSLDTNKTKTVHSYADAKRMFLKFVATNKMHDMCISEFTKEYAYAYRDFLSSYEHTKGKYYRAKTVNNHITFTRLFFEEMTKRNWIKSNPFSRIPKKKEQDPIQRAYTHDEAALLFEEIKKDPTLLLAQTLLYRTAIRPIEIARLKPKFFDFKQGIIKLPGADTKQNKKVRVINIPLEIVEYLKQNIVPINDNWYIFGEKLQPHPNKQCGRNTLNLRHSIILKRLHAQGKIADLTGLCFYSWKDTAAFHYIEAGMDIVSLKELFGHASIETTQRYFKRYGIINDKIQNIKL